MSVYRAPELSFGTILNPVSAGGTIFNPFGTVGGTTSTTEAEMQVKLRTAGVVSRLGSSVFTNGSGSTSTIRLRKNTANGNLVISLVASTTGFFQDAVNSDSVASTDVLDYSLARSAGANSLQVSGVCSLFFSNVTPTKVFTARGSGSGSGAFPIAIVGNIIDFTETAVQLKVKSAGTFKNYGTQVASNTIAATSTLAFRKNTANGNGSVSVTGSTTGIFEDTTHTDAVVVNDLVDWIMTNGGAGAISWVAWCHFESTNGTFDMAATGGTLSAVSPSGTLDCFLESNLTSPSTGDTIGPCLGLVGTVSLIRCFVSTNSISATSTLALTKNAVAGNGSASITSNSTGWFEDATHSDVVDPLDVVHYKLTAGGTGTSILVRTFAAMIDTGTTTIYSMGANAVKPTTNADLGTDYTNQNYIDVDTDDGTRVSVSGAGFVLHQFKKFNANNTNQITINWNGQSSVAASSKTVRLEIYNYNTVAWESLATNTSAAANTDFTLTGGVTSSLSNYYGTLNEVSARVYQDS